MKISVTILKPISRPGYTTPFAPPLARILYDAKRPQAHKLHALYLQQSAQYGTVGDQCDYISHSLLLKLEAEGFVTIQRRKTTRKEPQQE